MSNQNEVGTESGPYRPSARKSIHHHNDHISLGYIDMGGYGLHSRREVKSGSSPSHDQGRDEVDAAMSKFARQTSPVPIRKNRIQRKERRNNFNISESEFSDDDESESNLLAKSLPANLPSYHCSNDFTHESLQSDFFKSLNSISIPESVTTPMNKSNEYNQNDYSTSASFEEYIDRNQNTQASGKSCLQILIASLFVICAIPAAFYYYGLSNLSNGTNNYYDEFKFQKDMNVLGEKYKINNNSILEVQSGISTILQRNDTGSFVFVYNGNSVKFNYIQFSNFMQEISSTAARYLRNHTTPNQPTVLHSTELNMQSHSELMMKYRHEVDKTGVMLVKDVDRIPSSLAMAFHYFCDEYNPLVAKSAIFFTLNLANCSNLSEQKSTHKDVEKCLANVWDAIPKDNIKPLLARVVNVVIDVTDVN